ncbi:hypothetical protein TrVGV298_000526 [Trichoderma virens]|nr:hypothetical protein TrVGV298_000526 [Trichoderma virens]
MKFAKELEREAVPEWRIKYLNYKAGKKYVKAVASAIQRTSGSTPRLLNPRRTPTFFSIAGPQTEPSPKPSSRFDNFQPSDEAPRSSRWHGQSGPVNIATQTEDEALNSNGNSLGYGSFVPTPPPDPRPLSRRLQNDDNDDLQDGQDNEQNGNQGDNQGDGNDDDFELPAPAIYTTSSSPGTKQSLSPGRKAARFNFHRSNSSGPLSSGTLPTLIPKDVSDDRLRRIFSSARESARITGLPRQSLDLVREREQQFYAFLDSELDKVETFYKKNEDRAGQRLAMLREQLHEMRNRRIQEIANERANNSLSRSSNQNFGEGNPDKSSSWIHPLKNKIFPPGPNSKSFQDMPRTPHLAAGSRANNDRMDYVRRPENHEVTYRTAKRKLKLAMQEFYRSLELLKSYAMLNRTAFRKLNKKYDKAVNARPPMRYMNEKVKNAWFVNSDVLEAHIKSVEDLYARYFERGNQKLAVGKLRKLHKKPKDESGSSFLNGFLIGTGIVFSIQGLVYGTQLLNDNNPTWRLLLSGFYPVEFRIWDLFMDFSILQPQSRHTALRDILALKHRWIYYVIMIVDPVLRFSWIFYAIFTHDLQHSTIVSFMRNTRLLAMSPSPYHIEPLLERASIESSPILASEEERQAEPQPPRPQPAEHPSFYDSASSTAVAGLPSGSLRRRTDLSSPHITRSFSKILAEAHKQDFEKKRKPVEEAGEEAGGIGQSDDFDDDDDDEDDDAGSLSDMRPRNSGDAA